MAGLKKAVQEGHVNHDETAVLDSTAHMLKFVSFQEMYFQNRFPPEFEVIPRKELINAPIYVKPDHLHSFPEPGRPLQGQELEEFVGKMAGEIARLLKLKSR